MARKRLVLENGKRLVPSGEAVVWRSKSGKAASCGVPLRRGIRSTGRTSRWMCPAGEMRKAGSRQKPAQRHRFEGLALRGALLHR